MIGFLIRKFIPDSDNVSSPAVRRRYGEVCGFAGILLNGLLFALKLLAGLLSGSIAVVADALNNLSDAGSSVVTLFGFRIAGKRPDSEHPYGHGRMEYVSGLLVSVMVLFMAAELLRSSLDKVLHPADIDVSALTLGILVVSVGIKLYMALFNRRYGEKIDSDTLRATAADSRNDVLATSAVLLAALLERFAHIRADGWCGIAIGLFVFASGIRMALNTIGTILGRRPDEHFVREIRELAESHPGILGVHDIMIHDYGPGQMMASLHAEVPASGDLMELHSLIEHIQDELEEKLGCRTVIHMDPVEEDDGETREMRRLVSGILYGIDPDITIHDFRVGKRDEDTVLSFDVLVPYGFTLSDEELRERITQAVGMIRACVLTVHIDRGESG